MLQPRWTERARADLLRIQALWTEAQPARIPSVFAEINDRILGLCRGHYSLGQQAPSLGPAYRSVLERRYGYRIHYRIDGDPPDTITILAVRHGRQRPLDADSLRRAGED